MNETFGKKKTFVKIIENFLKENDFLKFRQILLRSMGNEVNERYNLEFMY